MRRIERVGLVLLLVLVFVLAFGACTSKVVPPGTTIIVLKTSGETEIKTAGTFTAWGRDRVYLVDSRLASFTEKMKILCADDVNMDVDVKWVGSFDVSREKIAIIKTKVPSTQLPKGSEIEGFTLSLKEFYKIAMKDIVRSNSRTIVSPYVTDNIRPNRKVIEKAISAAVISQLTALNYPVKTSAVLVSNLDYDPIITEQRKAIKKAQLEDQRKAALAEAQLAEAFRQEELAREEGKARIVKAQTRAAENMIVSASITPQVLAMKQWEVLEVAANSGNNEFFVVPYEAMKTSDLMGTAINKQVLEKLLAEFNTSPEARAKARAEADAKLVVFKKKNVERQKALDKAAKELDAGEKKK